MDCGLGGMHETFYVDMGNGSLAKSRNFCFGYYRFGGFLLDIINEGRRIPYY
jgi:hypothetical protein